MGQETRLRDGVLLADAKLDRFHAGHGLVKFFYGGIRQLPEYLDDALLVWGISVTLVKSDDLLVFRHVREHQSFHTGRSSIFTSIIRSATPSSATTSWT